MTSTTRQRRKDEPNSHEVYFNGQFVDGGLPKQDARRKQRALRRREEKRNKRYDD